MPPALCVVGEQMHIYINTCDANCPHGKVVSVCLLYQAVALGDKVAQLTRVKESVVPVASHTL